MAKARLGSGKRFASLTSSLSKKQGIHDPAALAATIGRNKLGDKKFNHLAKLGRARKKR